MTTNTNSNPFRLRDHENQAFPHGDPTNGGCLGMTLRDYIATHALGMGFDWVNLHETGGYAEAAQVAYEVADAMLEARKAGPK
jgi:hypothetical protein